MYPGVFREGNKRIAQVNGKKILLLQGPIGPFFGKFQTYLNNNGWDAWRVTFNAGDRLYCSNEKRIDFKGKLAELKAFYLALLDRNNFQCVVVFGCERPVHRIALAACKARGVPVVSLEEGYIRPGYITVEDGGNNWRSPLAGKLPSPSLPPTTKPVRRDGQSSFKVMGWHAIRYYVSHAIASSGREKRNFHRRPRVLRLPIEGLFWIRSLLRRHLNGVRNFGTFERLLEAYDKRYYVVPLQVSDDTQLGAWVANGWNNEVLILKSIDSFARSAPTGTRLVFKVHPQERGHQTRTRFIRNAAEIHGVWDRVDIVDSGSLGLLTRHSAGLITINSTAGFSAIFHGTPLGVAGRAFYTHPKLAHSISSSHQFDQFWTEAAAAPAELRHRYLNWVRTECLVEGDFYLPGELSNSMLGVVRKMEEIIEKRHAEAHVLQMRTFARTNTVAS